MKIKICKFFGSRVEDSEFVERFKYTLATRSWRDLSNILPKRAFEQLKAMGYGSYMWEEKLTEEEKLSVLEELAQQLKEKGY